MPRRSDRAGGARAGGGDESGAGACGIRAHAPCADRFEKQDQAGGAALLDPQSGAGHGATGCRRLQVRARADGSRARELTSASLAPGARPPWVRMRSPRRSWRTRWQQVPMRASAMDHGRRRARRHRGARAPARSHRLGTVRPTTRNDGARGRDVAPAVRVIGTAGLEKPATAKILRGGNVLVFLLSKGFLLVAGKRCSRTSTKNSRYPDAGRTRAPRRDRSSRGRLRMKGVLREGCVDDS